jgi:phospho-N-acetylmuramoyl-pentapeptide-transferase
MAVLIFFYAVGIIDGIVGLSGGFFGIVFAGYSLVAFFQGQIDLSAFCATMVGGILAFLWFNIPPARFYMTETGSMALTLTLAVVIFMTDVLSVKNSDTEIFVGGYGVLSFLLIGAPLVMTVLSNIIQQLSKKIRGKKVFLIAPLHHHFEAIGWPACKVVMRYWVLSIVFCFVGVVFALIG